MEQKDRNQRKEDFRSALRGKNVPVLTLDHKWYRLLDETGRAEVREIEDKLNVLLKRQGRLNTESKDIRRLKKKLMNEIVSMADEETQGQDEEVGKQMGEHRRIIEECNEKLESYQDELLELPREIERLNTELMLLTMENCYGTIQRNTTDIRDIEQWVTQIRIELKKRLIRKQEMEQKNHEMYSYMHDIFGAEVLNLFDLKYNPEEQHPIVAPKESEQDNS